MTQETKVIVSIGIAILIILIGGVLFLNKTDQRKASLVNADPAILTRNANHKVTTTGAKLTIVEFADFQCPACARTHPVIKQLLDEYKGKITFIYRHFPLPQHNNAIPAAKAAEAAGEQGKFWEMYDLLYQRQTEWSESNDATQIFTQYAKELGLNTTAFSQAILNNKFNDTIQTDKNDGVTLGVNSTPTFFINNQKIVEAPTYKYLSKKIADELNK